MKALPKILLALTAVAALSIAHPVKANLITNPGFETGDFTGRVNGGFGSVDTSNPHSGQYAAMCFGGSRGGGGFGQFFSTTLGSTYTLSFWLAITETIDSGFLKVILNNTEIEVINASPSGFGYSQFTLNLIGTGGLDELDFAFKTNDRFWYLDDVSLALAGQGGSRWRYNSFSARLRFGRPEWFAPQIELLRTVS
jgi:hypothetical protein